eukprot:gene12782-3741_t
MELSDKVAASIGDYVERISREDGSTLDLSDEGLSVWTDELRDAILLQLSVMIDTDHPINTVDLSDNNFHAGTQRMIEAVISADFNAPNEIILSGNPGFTAQPPSDVQPDVPEGTTLDELQVDPDRVQHERTSAQELDAPVTAPSSTPAGATAAPQPSQLPAVTPEEAHSNKVAASIGDYVDSWTSWSTLDLSDEGLSVWTDELRDAILLQLSVMIDTDHPINSVDLSDNNFDTGTQRMIEAVISADFNAPATIHT